PKSFKVDFEVDTSSQECAVICARQPIPTCKTHQSPLRVGPLNKSASGPFTAVGRHANTSTPPQRGGVAVMACAPSTVIVTSGARAPAAWRCLPRSAARKSQQRKKGRHSAALSYWRYCTAHDDGAAVAKGLYGLAYFDLCQRCLR